MKNSMKQHLNSFQDNNIYNVSDCIQLLEKVGPFEEVKGAKKSKYINAPFAFDIETTNTRNSMGEKISFMYVWTFAIYGYVIMGRTWAEFLELIQILTEYFDLSLNRRMIIYIHNMAFDFQFFRKYFDFESVFSLELHKPIKALTTDGIEFRCSFVNTNKSLKKVAEDIQIINIEKKTGDLDYDKIRHYKTPLTEEEKQYCIYDVKIITAYILEQMSIYESINKIPLTSTGYVREYVKKCCFEGHPYKKKRYHELIKNIRIKDEKEYNMLKQAFQGGFTHANALYSGDIIENVASYDFTSSYPAVMISEQFPMSEGVEIKIKSNEELKEKLKYYCLLMEIEYINIRAKQTVYEHPISASRCWLCEGAKKDNGRIMEADRIRMTITEQDFNVIKAFYDYDGIRIGKCIQYRKGYLPVDFVKAILSLYEDKTKLKGVKGKELEYTLKKAMLNACYGMSVTDIIRDLILYYEGDYKKYKKNDLNDENIRKELEEKGVEIKTIQEQLDDYNDNWERFLAYQWGVWITAYARRNLFTAIYSIGEDYIYSDTDSVKIKNYKEHEEYFEKYNSIILKKLYHTCDVLGLDRSSIEPETIKGIKKPLGVWDFEGVYKRFKTLGAKRYIVQNEDITIPVIYENINGGNDYIINKICESYTITCAGLGKKEGIKYIKLMGGDPMENFTNDLEIPADKTGKMTHTYIDEEMTAYVTDYKGNTELIHEESGIHLENQEYSLSISDEYLKIIEETKMNLKYM